METEEAEFGGYRWRITRPNIVDSCRVFAGNTAALSSGVISRVLTRLTATEQVQKDMSDAEEHEGEEFAAGRALEILKQAHLGKAVASADFGTLLQWLAPVLPGCNVESLMYWQAELFAAVGLEVNNGGEWGALPTDRELMRGSLGRLLPNEPPTTLFKLQLWAFLFTVRPTSAG